MLTKLYEYLFRDVTQNGKLGLGNNIAITMPHLSTHTLWKMYESNEILKYLKFGRDLLHVKILDSENFAIAVNKKC